MQRRAGTRENRAVCIEPQPGSWEPAFDLRGVLQEAPWLLQAPVSTYCEACLLSGMRMLLPRAHTAPCYCHAASQESSHVL